MNVELTDFAWALFHLRIGARLRRRDWPTRCWVVLQKGYPAGIPLNQQTADAVRLPAGTMVVVDPYFLQYQGDKVFTSWTPSTSDVLALDWELIQEDEEPPLPLLLSTDE